MDSGGRRGTGHIAEDTEIQEEEEKDMQCGADVTLEKLKASEVRCAL
jgi:hypothetical protein